MNHTILPLSQTSQNYATDPRIPTALPNFHVSLFEWGVQVAGCCAVFTLDWTHLRDPGLKLRRLCNSIADRETTDHMLGLI
ncbi:hypothetical protein JTE90_008163 [Oedothorax gibbosus]|uniref:Uncharacterized protein n=1 Tax=Oedothorax gibbosus TaxID=931172 RepID=A0AAV6VDX0_9ARAC|nr:hypothetical protein JTE90_008163 [Oedothorax gibbosus]